MHKHLILLKIGFICLFVNVNAQKQITNSTASNNKPFIAALEKQFDAALSAQNIDQTVKLLSAKPHHLGSEGGKEVVKNIVDKYKSYGFEVQIETYKVLFPTPKTRFLELLGSKPYKALLKEPSLKEDATSGQSNQLPTYNCWSADGDVTAPIVFVNYGLPSDYEVLKKHGIDVKGKIVIAKYGKSWRGIKPKVAQEHGALGCIIYSDPKDDGYTKGDVYPIGAFKNEFGVQRGSVMDMVVYPGDPLTPNIGATETAKRIDKSQAGNLLKIPVLPISYHDALPLLKSLQGPVAPAEWSGTLPITYHFGPSISPVHLQLSFDWKMENVQNVIARLQGTQFPDEWVIRGNHHDAWVNGANDPISGQSAMLEEAKALGTLYKSGWRPKRTIVYCSWDAEEPGLMGSTEWVEHHASELQEKAVAYINSDSYGRGFVEAEGSASLEDLVNEVTAGISDPQTKVSVLERKLAENILAAKNPKEKSDILSKSIFEIGALGSGSDYSPFIQHLGIPSLNIGFGGEDNGGEYHSIYDSYDHYKKFKDPTFEYGVALAKTAGHITLRLSEADILPFNFKKTVQNIGNYTKELQELIHHMRESTSIENKLIKKNIYSLANDPNDSLQLPTMLDEVPYIDFSLLQNALAQLDKTISNVQMGMVQIDSSKLQKVNQILYRAEQSLLNPEGLPQRPWYKHTIYAPGFYTGYGVKTMPGIREAIEQRNWPEAKQQIINAANAINALNNTLTKIFL